LADLLAASPYQSYPLTAAGLNTWNEDTIESAKTNLLWQAESKKRKDEVLPPCQRISMGSLDEEEELRRRQFLLSTFGQQFLGAVASAASSALPFPLAIAL